MALPWEHWTCNGCGQTNADGADVDEQHSLGIYAGRWCEPCWANSGYRKDGPEGFSPDDAGERYDEE